MATTTLRGGFGMPSPLAVDLALARVDLAALRARRGVQLDELAVPAARLLKDFYSRNLRAARTPVPIIPERLVPIKETREALQKGLASISRAKPPFDEARAKSVSRLVDLLSTLADTGVCGRDEARELHTLIRSLEPEFTLRPGSSKLAKLSESLDASP